MNLKFPLTLNIFKILRYNQLKKDLSIAKHIITINKLWYKLEPIFTVDNLHLIVKMTYSLDKSGDPDNNRGYYFFDGRQFLDKEQNYMKFCRKVIYY